MEPHADWNMLMQSGALDIQGYYDVFFGTATFFPGDKITFGFENKSTNGPKPFVGLYILFSKEWGFEGHDLRDFRDNQMGIDYHQVWSTPNLE